MTALWWTLAIIVMVSIYVWIMSAIYLWADSSSKIDRSICALFSLLWPVFWITLVAVVRHDTREERARVKLLKKGKL